MKIALEGIDGCGKSTIAPLLFERLAANFKASAFFDKKSTEFSDLFVQEKMSLLHDLLWKGNEPDYDPFGAQYWILLTAAWYSALERCRINRLDKNSLFVFDGWYYRNIAKAIVRNNVEKQWLLTLFHQVEHPDIVILLDIDPALVWRRKIDFKNSELGRWDGRHGDLFESFFDYQQQIRKQLLLFAEEYQWFVIVQTLGTTVQDMVEMISAMILTHLGIEVGHSGL